jgi:hypothetical protein
MWKIELTIPPGPLKGGVWNLQQMACAWEVPPSRGLGGAGRRNEKNICASVAKIYHPFL